MGLRSSVQSMRSLIWINGELGDWQRRQMFCIRLEHGRWLDASSSMRSSSRWGLKNGCCDGVWNCWRIIGGSRTMNDRIDSDEIEAADDTVRELRKLADDPLNLLLAVIVGKLDSIIGCLGDIVGSIERFREKSTELGLGYGGVVRSHHDGD